MDDGQRRRTERWRAACELPPDALAVLHLLAAALAKWEEVGPS